MRVWRFNSGPAGRHLDDGGRRFDDDTAGRGGIRRPRRGDAPGEREGRERQRHRRRRQHRHHVRLGQRRSRAGPRADQSRRECQTEEPAWHVGHHRSLDHRLRADHRRAAQGRRRSQFQNSGWRNSADGRRAQRQGGRSQGASCRGSRHQRQGNLGRTKRDHVGRRAKPGRHGEVPAAWHSQRGTRT